MDLTNSIIISLKDLNYHIKYICLEKLVGIYQVQELGIHVVEAEIYILLISSNRNRTFGVDLAIQLNQIYPSILTNKSINT